MRAIPNWVLPFSITSHCCYISSRKPKSLSSRTWIRNQYRNYSCHAWGKKHSVNLLFKMTAVLREDGCWFQSLSITLSRSVDINNVVQYAKCLSEKWYQWSVHGYRLSKRLPDLSLIYDIRAHNILPEVYGGLETSVDRVFSFSRNCFYRIGFLFWL